MLIGSIDIGIKTLSICVLEEKPAPEFFKIVQWKIIALANTAGKKALKCCHIMQKKEKKGTGRGKNKEVVEPMAVIQLTKKGKPKKIKPVKPILCGASVILYDNVNSVGYCGRHTSKYDVSGYVKYLTTKNISDYELCSQIIKELDAIDELFLCDEILIENQLKQNMVRIEYMIFSYLTNISLKQEKGGHIKNVKILSAVGKLDLDLKKIGVSIEKDGEEVEKDGENEIKKKTYKDRKKMSVQICGELLKKQEEKFSEIFNRENKKDDLADCFLQGVSYILKKC